MVYDRSSYNMYVYVYKTVLRNSVLQIVSASNHSWINIKFKFNKIFLLFSTQQQSYAYFCITYTKW